METHKIISSENSPAPVTGRLALDVKDVVRLTGLSRAKIYHLWSEGKGPPRLKCGKRTLILAAALTAWLATLEVPSNGSAK